MRAHLCVYFGKQPVVDTCEAETFDACRLVFMLRGSISVDFNGLYCTPDGKQAVIKYFNNDDQCFASTPNNHEYR